MTMISGLGAPTPSGRSRGAAPATGFAVPDQPPRTVAADGVPAATALSAGLLALQADEAGAAQDRAARHHGRGVLAALAGLQRALLEGSGGAGSLAALAGLVANMPQAADPRLRAVQNAIVLRARVELARNEACGPAGPATANK